MRAKELAGIVTKQSVLSLDGLLSQVPGTGIVKQAPTHTGSSFTLPHTFKKRLGIWQGLSFFGGIYDISNGICQIVTAHHILEPQDSIEFLMTKFLHSFFKTLFHLPYSVAK